jgi:hypothetical protein
MKKAFIISFLTLFVFVTVGNVFGEEMAKEGTGSGHSYASGIWKGYPLEEGTQFLTWEQKGVCSMTRVRVHFTICHQIVLEYLFGIRA